MTDTMSRKTAIPSVSLISACNGRSANINEHGMRPMQERVWAQRGEQYLLIKSPPASGKSRALMFVALDKLTHQGIRKAIITVPEKFIGASFNDAPLRQAGFFRDWCVAPRWNLCHAPGGDGGKINDIKHFLDSEDDILVCTHASFRLAVDRFGVDSFDNCLIAVDEFHHASANPDNKLGTQLGEFIARDKVHIVAMTGSYFRGDAVAVLAAEDENRFATVTYTYYEQLNGYSHLKNLDIGYYFYDGTYADSIMAVLDPEEKTIIHIPHVASRESTKDKYGEVDHLTGQLGEWQGQDPATGFHLIKTPTGRILRIANLVEDNPALRETVSAALKGPEMQTDRDHVDIIIALGMAKEGFDWIWCEHALTVGYRASLTEIVQIIGRATRDAPGKTRARFTNLIAEPDATEEAVTDAVNDTLKAIAACLLMEQVLTPRFDFRPKTADIGPLAGFDYGEGGYDMTPGARNVGFCEARGTFDIAIKGLAEPKSALGKRVCKEDLIELTTSFLQDKTTLERGLFDTEMIPEELTQVSMGKIIAEKYPEMDAGDQEAVRQRAVAALNIIQQVKYDAMEAEEATGGADAAGGGDAAGGESGGNAALIAGVRKFVTDVRELDIDLIDRINPFLAAYAILAKSMDEERLKQVSEVITAKRIKLTPDEARSLARRAVAFMEDRGRAPSMTAHDPWERHMAEGVAVLSRMKREAEAAKAAAEAAEAAEAATHAAHA